MKAGEVIDLDQLLTAIKMTQSKKIDVLLVHYSNVYVKWILRV